MSSENDLLLAQVGELPDTATVEALRQIVEKRDGFATWLPPLFPHTDRQIRDLLIESLPEGNVAGDRNVSEAAVARATLEYLAAQASTTEDARLIKEALTVAPTVARLDPFTIAVGAVVLIALRTEVEAEYTPKKGWHLHFKVKPMSDSALVKVLTLLLRKVPGSFL
jgi:hypothetical protein